MKKAAVATLALISLLLGGCSKKEEPVNTKIPAAEGAGRRISFAAGSGDAKTTDAVDSDEPSTAPLTAGNNSRTTEPAL